MPCMVRRWQARVGMESHLRQALVQAHADVFPQGGQGLESALYREHIEGREFLGLALYVDEAALESPMRRQLLETFAQLEARYADRPTSALRLTILSEYVSIGRPVVSGSAALLRCTPASAPELGERVTAIARQLVERLSPSRILTGFVDEDPGLFVFIEDTEDNVDLARYLASTLHAEHMRDYGPLLIEAPRWYSLDPTWRYFRGRQQR